MNLMFEQVSVVVAGDNLSSVFELVAVVAAVSAVVVGVVFEVVVGVVFEIDYHADLYVHLFLGCSVYFAFQRHVVALVTVLILLYG